MDAPRGGLPVWVVYAAALAMCGGLFLWVTTALNAASDNQYARMLGAPPASMPQISRAVVVQPPPPPPAPPEPDILDRLRASLKADIDSGAVSVVGTAATPVVRVGNRNGFAAGRAVLPPAMAAVFERIGAVLRNVPGSVQVIALYRQPADPNRAISLQLSALRRARTGCARGDCPHDRRCGPPAAREGRADADPIASNATADGREQNRRIEIVLHRDE